MIYSLALAPILIAAAIFFLVRVKHKWRYSNPYNRTCKICKQNQITFGFKMVDAGWWEVNSPGEPLKHKHWADKPVLRSIFWREIFFYNLRTIKVGGCK